jgi:protein-L-isoaspartate(D-aspartate) O-methyltransferase
MSADFAAARLNMLDSQVRPADVTDWALQDAIGAAPRESVVPAQKGFAAYADAEVEYAPGRWLLRPRDVSKLLQALRPEAGERALAIAAPYAALVLETMGLSVDRLDGETLTAVPGADYDLIIVEGAVAKTPEAWTVALAQGGRLGVIERNGPAGKAVIYVRALDGVGARPIFEATPPWLAGFEPVHGFAF